LGSLTPYLDAIPHPAACPVMGTHPNVEMKRQGSRPSRTHVWAYSTIGRSGKRSRPLAIIFLATSCLSAGDRISVLSVPATSSACRSSRIRIPHHKPLPVTDEIAGSLFPSRGGRPGIPPERSIGWSSMEYPIFRYIANATRPAAHHKLHGQSFLFQIHEIGHRPHQ